MSHELGWVLSGSSASVGDVVLAVGLARSAPSFGLDVRWRIGGAGSGKLQDTDAVMSLC